MDINYNYRADFSGQKISDVGIEKTLEVLRQTKGTTGKFGLGCAQWTGSRTNELMTFYVKECGENGYPNLEQCARAEANMLLILQW